MSITLYQYQKTGIDWLVTNQYPRLLLADEQGLGKTPQSIGYLKHVQKDKTLIVCPSSLLYTWQNAIDIFYPEHPPIELLTTQKLASAYKFPTGPRIAIVSYTIAKKLQKQSIDTLIVDEAHYIKSPSAQRTKTVVQLSQLATKSIFLTGTPTPNDVIDIYTISKLLGAHNFTYDQFGQLFCYKKQFTINGHFAKKITQYYGCKDKKSLSAILNRFTLRREKKEILTQLPDKTYATYYSQLDEKKAIELCTKYLDYYPTEIKQGFSLGDAFDTQTLEEFTDVSKFATIRSNLALLKVPSTIQFIENHFEASGHPYNTLQPKHTPISPLIIFGIHKQALKLLHAYSPHSALITGETSPIERQRIVSDFTNYRIPILFANIDAAGTGLNLQASNTIFFHELSWTLGSNLQAEDRIHRIGQTSNKILIYRSHALNTLDDFVIEAVNRKQKSTANILG